MPPMRWQDLIYQKCPSCSARLVQVRGRSALMYRCFTTGCGFLISHRRLKDILCDENHKLREYVSDEQRNDLAKIITLFS